MKILSFLLLGITLACSNGSSFNNDLASESKAASYELSEKESGGVFEETNIDGAQLSPAPKQEQKIIKTGHLAFETKDPDATHRKIMDLTKSHDGFVQNDNSGKSYNRLYRTITVRVPTEKFQSFIDAVSEGVPYFDQKDISRKDVTEEFIDLEARLKAKRELERRYLELLTKAKNVKEMLEIERELSTIREEIEAKQGRLNYLQNKVSLSTVNIEFYKLTSETGVTLSYGQKMKNAFKGGWDGISVFFLGLLYLWPLYLIIAIIFLVIRRIIKRKKRKI